MGRGSSKVGGAKTVGKAASMPRTNNEYTDAIDDLARGVIAPYNEEEGVYPMSNGDVQAAVEAYAMTHPNVDEDAMYTAVLDRAAELKQAENDILRKQIKDQKNGTFNNLVQQAEGLPDNRVVLSYTPNAIISDNTKRNISGLLSLTAKDVKDLDRTKANNGSLSKYFRTSDNTRYQVVFSLDNKSNVNYSLKKGNKFIVKNGTADNIALQIDHLLTW